jgi:hypothetical protein
MKMETKTRRDFCTGKKKKAFSMLGCFCLIISLYTVVPIPTPAPQSPSRMTEPEPDEGQRFHKKGQERKMRRECRDPSALHKAHQLALTMRIDATHTAAWVSIHLTRRCLTRFRNCAL